MDSWTSQIRRATGADSHAGRCGRLFAVSAAFAKTPQWRNLLKPHVHSWQMTRLAESDAETMHFQGPQGPIWILRETKAGHRHAVRQAPLTLHKTGYSRFRDLAGATFAQIMGFSLDKLIVELHGLSLEEEQAVFIGLELANYSFSENWPLARKSAKARPRLLLKAASQELDDHALSLARSLASAVNLARHYVNLPAGTLNPRTFAESVRSLFSDSSTSEVEIWQGDKLRNERMTLLLAVGGAAAEGPRLVHIRYRPKSSVAGLKPIAIVGKGITFDSGGLDIKPSSAMRWMKKDMGGAAAAVAIAKWAESVQLEMPLDIYLSLAENAVGSSSFRPGDVLTSRAGLTIEIQNTDAEGRLVLADALDVAVTRQGEDEPAAVINIATLTGAIKVGLGTEIAGLFSNSDRLADEIVDAGWSRGDLCWRMPLYEPYKTGLRSTFADHANSADGFGGAITAALFLELFVRHKTWAHLDIYAWKDAPGGALSEAGGNGQAVQALAETLMRLVAKAKAGVRE